MTPILSINLRIKITPTIPVADVRIRVTPPHSGPFDPLIVDPDIFDVGWEYSLQPHIDISVDGDLATSVFPRTLRQQVISPFLLSIGGNEIPYYRRKAEMIVSESIDGISSFTFSMPRRNTSELDSYIEPLGQPKAWLGVPGGKQSVDISAKYLTEGGQEIIIPLIKNGLLDNSSSQISLQSDTRTWNGGGAHARIDRKSITYQAPPGHGQKSSTVVRRILELAGIDSTKINISNGRRMYKEISLIDAKPIESCNQILLPENRRLFHDSRTDTWTTVDYSGIEGKRVECIITESDVLEAIGSFGDSEANDAPTSIVLTSTAQVTRDQCGRRTTYQIVDTFGIREIRGARSVQQTDGTITPLLSWRGAPSELRKVSRLVVVKEYDCETLVAEETVTWGWFSPQTVRYKLSTDGTFQAYRSGFGSWFYDIGVEPNDNLPLYSWVSERWVPISSRRIEHQYDDRGYLVSSIESTGGWDITEAPIKERVSINDSWELAPYREEWVLADGRAVKWAFSTGEGISLASWPSGEYWRGPRWSYDETRVPEEFVTTNQLLSLRRTRSAVIIHKNHPLQWVGPPESQWVYTPSREEHGTLNRVNKSTTVNNNGYKVSEINSITRREPRPGLGKYLYQNGVESSDDIPFWGTVERKETKWSIAGESNHDEFFLRFDRNGKLIENKESFGLEGYLPVADQRQDIVPPVSFFDDPTEHEFALAASRHENRPIKVEINVPALESAIEPWQMKGVTVQYAENEQDLANLGTFMIRELSSIQIDYPLLLNALLRPGHRVILHLPSLGIHYDHIIINLLHSQSNSISYTQVTGRYDVI